jgi:hypothetical protein
VFTIDPVATGCAGPSGLAVGPSNQMALGCGGTNSLVINSTNGKVAVTVSGEGGTDEAWYNPTANQYYFARSTAGVLGVENAGPPATAASTNNTPTAVGSHSVAADLNQISPSNPKSQVYVPIRTRSCGHSPYPYHSADQEEHGQIRQCRFLVSCRNPTIVLDLVDEAFDQVALLVEVLVVRNGL